MKKKLIIILSIVAVIVLVVVVFAWRILSSKRSPSVPTSSVAGGALAQSGSDIGGLSASIQISESSSSTYVAPLDRSVYRLSALSGVANLPEDQKAMIDAVSPGGVKKPETDSMIPPIDSGVDSKPEVGNSPDEDVDGDGLTASQELQAKTNPKKADTDGDGLSDGDELRRTKTDPNNADTDGDELTDGEESLVYHTQPLLPDTDGDGYTDGKEVQSGYNPLGKGKL